VPDDVPILPILQKLKKQMALRQQEAAGEAAAASGAAALAAAPGFGTAAAAGGGPLGSGTSTILQRLLQQNRQLQSIAAANSGGLERQQGEGRPAHRSASTPTNSTGIAGLGLYTPAACVGDALRMQQQQAVQMAGVEGPYSSYLDAELLNLYSEFKTRRKQVRLGCYSVSCAQVGAAPAQAVQASCMHDWLEAALLINCAQLQAANTCCPVGARHLRGLVMLLVPCAGHALLYWLQVLAIVKEAVHQGVMNSNVVRRLQQPQHMRQGATDSPSFTTGAAATQSAGAAQSGGAGGTFSSLLSLGKRARDQQGAGPTADAAAVDADAPSSKLRRTKLNMASGSAAAGAADTVSGKTAGNAAAEPEGQDMDVSAPNDSSACAYADSAAAAPAGADAATGATAAAAPTAEAATAADSDAQAAATPKAEPAAAAAVREPASPGADGSLLPRSVEALVLVHSLTNRVLAKAVSAKKEVSDALMRAEQFSAMTASSHSSIQHLQLQNQMLQQQLQLAQIQLQAKQQQLVQVQARSQHVSVAYPQLVGHVAKCVNRLVSTAHHDHLPVAERQELAAVAEDLLAACNLQ
jgi:hypothetical protein